MIRARNRGRSRVEIAIGETLGGGDYMGDVRDILSEMKTLGLNNLALKFRILRYS